MASSRDPAVDDIQVVPKKSRGGKDYIIGDLHGNRKCLEAVLEKLQPNDRLFIVGDLTDRGEDSPGVINLIEENNSDPSKTQIHCIRGNHETLCLNTINGLEKYVPEVGTLPPMDRFTRLTHHNPDIQAALGKAQHHMKRNGGEWLIELFRDELRSKPPKILVDNGEIFYRDDSQVKRIKEYMASLPYMIRIKGIPPRNIVHADAPYNDELMKKMIRKKIPMTDKEKDYATWARQAKPGETRKNDYTDNGRNEYSSMTTVGHNIVKDGIPVVRYSTNTLDADVGAYDENAILLINATDGVSELVSVNGATPSEKLIAVRDEANVHLAEQHALSPFLKEVKRAKDRVSLDKIVQDYAQRELKIRATEFRGTTYSPAELYLIAINNDVISSSLKKSLGADEALMESIHLTNLLGSIKNYHTLDSLAEFLAAFESSSVQSITNLLTEQAMTSTLSKIFAAGLHPNLLGVELIKDILSQDPDNAMLKVLLDAGFDVNAFPDSFYEAIMNDARQHDVLKLLLTAGLDANKVMANGSSLMHLAVSNELYDHLQTLLNHGGSTSIKDVEANDTTPLGLARTFGLPDAINVMVNDYSAKHAKYPLLSAVNGGEIEMVTALLESNKFDVNASHAETGHTALLIAVAQGKTAIAEELLDHDADVSRPLNNGLSALHISVAENNLDMTELLIKHGADINASAKTDKLHFLKIFETASPEVKSAAKEYFRRQAKSSIDVTPETIAIIVSQGDKNSALIKLVSRSAITQLQKPLEDDKSPTYKQ